MNKVSLILWIFLTGYISVSAQCVTTFPYLEDFETGTGSWISGGTNSDWAYGSPSKPNIQSAGSGIKCWITGGLTNAAYNSGEKSWLKSPCFDFTTLKNPYIQFLIYWDTERQYDGGGMQYSINGGTSWVNIGTSSDPVNCLNANWFNASISNLTGFGGSNQGWSGTLTNSGAGCVTGNGSGKWVTAKHCIGNLAGQPNVMFRFTFCSGTACNAFDGIAIDSIFIGEVPKPNNQINYSCNGLNTIKFDGVSDGCITAWSWNFGDPISGTSNTATGQSVSHQFSSAGNFTVSMFTTQTCSGTDTLQQQIGLQNFNIYTSSVTCQDGNDGTAQVDVSNFPNPTVTWNTNPPLTTDSIGGLSVGSYTVVVTDPAFCPVQKTAIINYGPDAIININLGADQRICPGSTIILDAGNFYSIRWQDGSSLPQFNVDQPGIYYVDVANISGCTANDTIVITPGCGDNVWLPSAFTPNDDATNETFTAYAVALASFSLQIYNRMGQMIFSSTDAAIGWDGNYRNQQAPEGIYGYKVRYTLYDGTSYDKNGIFTLLR